jgi:aldehyde:ferredoxin oxidoreductase
MISKRKNMLKGWTGKILVVDLTCGRITTRNTEDYIKKFIGARGINTKIIFDEAGFTDDPFGPANILAIGAGVLSGTPCPAASRTTISAISPTGLLCSANIGGFVGPEMKYAGYDNVIIKGISPKPVYLFITNEKVLIKDAGRLQGQDPWKTQKMIREELKDRDIQSMAIGSAGENKVSFACVVTGKFQSSAGRNGMGAVMGSKSLKAVAFRGKGAIRVAEPKKFLESCLTLHISAREHSFFESRRSSDPDKLIFTRQFESGKFVAGNWEGSNWKEDGLELLKKDPEKIWEQGALHLQNQTKNNPTGQQPGCHGCPFYHETYFNIPKASDIAMTKCVQLVAMGPIVWLTDHRELTEAGHLSDKYGLDVVSLGNCISFLMELHGKGIIDETDTDGIAMERGDIRAIRLAAEKIANQKGFGKWFKEGVAGAGKIIGKGAQECALHIKGLELYPEEARAYKSMALSASVSKMEQLPPLDYAWYSDKGKKEALALEKFGTKEAAQPDKYTGKAQVIADFEDRTCIGDMFGLCKSYVPWGITQEYDAFASRVKELTGILYKQEDFFDAAKRVAILERAFNAVQGITRKDERPPQRLFDTPITHGRFKGEHLDEEKFQEMLSQYYALKGCNEEGLPTLKTFAGLKLEQEMTAYQKAMQDKGNEGQN